ncbi:MAG: MBL fold metallo-hydrolase [Candidatus Riflebacteria bacterium]|nr:MBL fold metallo-hydrolase [Candidatus Riflebacteria bacterium]
MPEIQSGGKSANTVVPAKGSLAVRVINVGKGDAILIQLPDGKNVMIDTGYEETSRYVTDKLFEYNVDNIDLLIVTHPDKDHIGGLNEIRSAFEIASYVESVDLKQKEERGRKIFTPKICGTRPLLAGNGYSLSILAPLSNSYNDVNDCSIVVKLTFGEIEFLFAGDALDTSEREMLNAKLNLKADVLKVAHHGRGLVCSREFLNAVSPKYAIITCGEDSKDSCDREVEDKLETIGAEVFKTSDHGTIHILSDGKNIEVKP